MPVTSVSAVRAISSLCLNRTDSEFELSVLGVIVPIPQSAGTFSDIIKEKY